MALKKIAAGTLTKLVEQELGPKKISFKEKLLAVGHGPEREKLILAEIFKRYTYDSIRKNMVPITVQGPNGMKFRYKVLPDYLMIDGVRISVSGQTAQKIVDRFKLNLPSWKQSGQILAATKPENRIRATPLSSSGYTTPEGRYIPPDKVVASHINRNTAGLDYNEKTNKLTEGKKGLVAGHGKDILAPRNPDKLGLGGWQGKDKNPLEGSVVTGHSPRDHWEYASWIRPIDSNVEVIHPDGKVEKAKMDDISKHPEWYKAVANTPGVKRYSYT